MADKRIVDLTPLVTQAPTDIYEVSANGAGSFKETRLQMASYIIAQGIPFTAKGDLLTSNGTSNVVLPPGTDGEVLESNSTAADGIDWTPNLKDAALNPSVAFQARTLLTSSGNISLNWGNFTAVAPGTSGNPSINWNARILYDGVALSFAPSVAWGLRILYDPSTVVSLSWISRQLIDSSALLSMDWQNRYLYANDGSTIVLDYSQTEAVRIGSAAGISSATGAVAIGFEAGNTSQSSNGIAIGTASGLTSQGTNAIAIGVNAGNANQSGSAVALGLAAGATGQGADAVAVGVSAGANNQGENSVAIGTGAGATSQGANAVAIGNVAAGSNQPANTVAIGGSASLTGAGSTVLGYNARDNGFTNSIALGSGATNTANNQAILPAGVTWDASSLPPAGRIPFSSISTIGPTQMVSDNGYVTNVTSPSAAVLILPIAPALGDIVMVQGYGAAGWQINVGTASMLRIGSSLATSNIASSNQWDEVVLRCVSAASGGQWKGESVIGNITIN
jgi:hypothetical protein